MKKHLNYNLINWGSNDVNYVMIQLLIYVAHSCSDTIKIDLEI